MKEVRDAIVGGALVISGSILFGAIGIIQALSSGMHVFNIRSLLPIIGIIAIIIFFAGILKILDTKSKE